MDGIEIEHVELNRSRQSCSIDEETIGSRRFDEQITSRDTIDRAFEARSQRCQARTRPRRNEREKNAASPEHSRTRSENDQARRSKITIRTTTDREGMLKRLKKELNDAMTDEKSSQKIKNPQNEKHAFSRVSVTSKGAKLKSKRKANSHFTIKPANARRSHIKHHINLNIAQHHLNRELIKRNRKELRRNAKPSTKRTQIESSGSKKMHAALQGCVRLRRVSRVPVQPTSEVLGFSCFSSFLDLEKSCLGAQHS